ncbi:MAG: Type fimbrial assembly protein PilC [Bacteriovoracaceae bacterium]|nr:Type fimbrial assembly protein PilC [Bacteriovoracaceae bacterium]
MPQYEYQGINSSGKATKGVVNSDNLQGAKSQLRRDGIFPSQILETNSRASESDKQGLAFRHFFKRVSTEDLSICTRQLATLVSAHVPLVDALSGLVEQIENEKLRAAISKVKSDVNEGFAFYKALSRFPDIFSELYCNMVAAGESSGALDIVLVRLADFLEYQDRLKKKVTAALIYPTLMLAIGFIVVMFIFTLVIPQIASIFEDARQTLPLITEIILNISSFLVSYWWAVIFVMILIAESIRRFLGSEFGKTWWDDKKLKLPVFGEMIRMIAVSRFTKTLATLLKSGVPLLGSLGIVKAVVSNRTISRAIEQATTDLTEGQNISNPLKKSGQFPPLMTHMINVGEKTGELEQMLEKVAEHYEDRVNAKVQNLTALLEPILIIGMAGIVLVIVLSIVLPLLQLNNAAL